MTPSQDALKKPTKSAKETENEIMVFKEGDTRFAEFKARMLQRATQYVKDPELDEFAKEFVDESLSQNTIEAYRKDVAIFMAWCETRDFNPLPATPNVVANFIAAQAHVRPHLKAMTIARRLAAIKCFHECFGIKNSPTKDEIVVKTLKGIKKKRGLKITQKAPTTHDIIHDLVDLIDTSTLVGIRDRALILLGFAGAFRRSELIAVKLEDITIQKEGMDVYVPKSKNDQLGEGKTKAIIRGTNYCPVKAVEEWIKAANITDGYLFRGLFPKSHKLRPAHFDPDKPELAGITVARIIKQYVARLGLEKEKYAGHSLRSGFVTSAILNGATHEKITEITGHKLYQTLAIYYRNVKRFQNNAGEGLL